MLFKIRTDTDSFKCLGTYLGEEQKFEFSNQSSQPPREFILFRGTVINLDFEAMGEIGLNAGAVVDLNGHFMDITKKTHPEPVFIVTGVNWTVV